MRLATPAIAPTGSTVPVARLQQATEHGLRILGKHLCAGWHLDHHVLGRRAGAVLAHTPAAALGLEVLAVAIVDQGIEVGDAFHPDVASLAAIAAVGSAELDEFLAPEGDAARTAVG